MVKRKNLHFFTDSFPFNNSAEGAFIVPEIEYTSKEFNKIYIYALKQKGKITYELPKNVEIIRFDIQSNKQVSLHIQITTFLLALKESVMYPEFRSIKTFRYLYALLKDYHRKATYINSILIKKIEKNDLLYTYWFAEWNYILSIFLNDSKLNNKLISRAHGFDLYDNRNQLKKIPFRNLQLFNNQAIYSISENGSKYLIDQFPKNKDKVHVTKLGIFDKGKNISPPEKATLVSCSSVVSVKRVHYIVEILKHIEYSLTWVHFGDGNLMPDLKTKINELPENINIELKGFVKNTDILNFYTNKNASLFINVSESEGIPVSIMEAISFGIPVIAFNVGGTSEIVTERTGQIFNNSNDVSKMVEFIQQFPNSKYNTLAFRKQVRTFWEEEFDASENHSNFSKQINQL